MTVHRRTPAKAAPARRAPAKPAPAKPAPAKPAAEKPAPAEPAPALPEVGTLARATHWDAYASPARDRTQLILVTGTETDETDGTSKVRGISLGYEDDAGAFVPGSLTWQ
jgi:hypothetical protein